jgi:hypothetical protein
MVGSGTCYRDLFSRCGVRAGLVDAVAKHQNPHRLTKENFSKKYQETQLDSLSAGDNNSGRGGKFLRCGPRAYWLPLETNWKLGLPCGTISDFRMQQLFLTFLIV